MLFITVAVILCRLGINNPPEFRTRWRSAERGSATVISMPAIFPPWNSPIQTKTSRSYTAASLLRDCISNKSGIAHCSSRLDSSAV